LSDVLKLDSKASTPLAITLPNERDPGRIMNGEETLEGKVKCSSSLAKCAVFPAISDGGIWILLLV
jgi:hypothetical protein